MHTIYHISKSSIMWFSIKPSPIETPPIVVNNAALAVVSRQRYLGVIFDSQLRWTHHVSGVCKTMSYYLMMISSHAKSLPSLVVKMLIESLVFSRYSYALPVWGPALHTDSLARLRRIHNRSVQLTCGLRKYDHVSKYIENIWDGCLLIHL